MARAFVLSHGARIGNYADTFVPAGRSISFFAEFDTNVLRLNGLAALSAGDYRPTETKVGPCEVSNYEHTRFEDFAIAQHLASESSAAGGKSYYVGQDLADPSYLCTTPRACRRSYPQHDPGCAGIFAKITEAEIYSVACRGLSGDPQSKTDNKLEGNQDLLTENVVEAKRILAWAQTDQPAAMRYWQSLNQPTRVALGTSYIPLRTYAAQYFDGGGESTPEAVLEARRYLDAYDDETFYTWIQAMPPGGRQQSLVLADQQLAAAHGRGEAIAAERVRADSAQQQWETESAATWVPSAQEVAAVAEINRATVKDVGDGDELDYEIAGFVVLVGPNHPADWYSWARGEADYAYGKLRVTKGGVFSKGGFEVESCPPAKQGVVESALGAFSEKDVTFV